VSAQIVNAIGVSRTTDLSFGAAVAGMGGQVVLSPSAQPTRIAVGGTTLGSPAGVCAATFSVTGQPGASFRIALPGPITITSGTSGESSMTVTDFRSSPSGTGTLAADGTTLYVGATLNVGADQPLGRYAGTFAVTVAYD
jgi:hypothetical protein